jgi:hypothetical protein
LDRKPGEKEAWTKTVWIYDLRTNLHFTLKTKRMTRADLDEFVECYRPGDRHNRKATWSEDTPEGRWRPYTYDEILRACEGIARRGRERWVGLAGAWSWRMGAKVCRRGSAEQLGVARPVKGAGRPARRATLARPGRFCARFHAAAGATAATSERLRIML